MAGKVTISKQISKRVVVVIEAEAPNATSAAKDATEALKQVKIK